MCCFEGLFCTYGDGWEDDSVETVFRRGYLEEVKSKIYKELVMDLDGFESVNIVSVRRGRRLRSQTDATLTVNIGS